MQLFLDVLTMFSQMTYNVSEASGVAKFILSLSEPSSTDITVEVFNTDGSATGEYCSTLILYLLP